MEYSGEGDWIFALNNTVSGVQNTQKLALVVNHYMKIKKKKKRNGIRFINEYNPFKKTNPQLSKWKQNKQKKPTPKPYKHIHY